MAVGVHTSKANTAGASSITTTGVATTSGRTLVAFCFIQSGAFNATTPISDSNGNTWSLLGSDITVVGGHARAYVATNITGGSGHTVTFSASSGGQFFAVFVCEVADVSASPTVTSAGNLDSSTPFTSPSISPSGACVLVSANFDSSFGGTVTTTWGGSFASGDKIEAQTDANNTAVGSMAANVQASGGTFSTSVTATSSGGAEAVFIVSVETSAGGTTQQTLMLTGVGP